MKNQSKYYFYKFHEASSIKKAKRLPSRDKWPESWKRIYFKGYPRFERIYLNKSAWFNKNYDLINTILERRSVRESNLPMFSKDDLSLLLLGGAITKTDSNVFYDSYRSYPSAGARYPCEIYIFLNKVKNLKGGLYHYHVRTHSLEYLWPINSEEIKRCFPNQNFVTRSKAIVIITAIMSRNISKYSERGYRFALLEAGHIGQNVCLIATAMGMSACPIGGFHDKNLADLIDIDSNEELPLYCVSIL